jgi:hypothetical protein
MICLVLMTRRCVQRKYGTYFPEDSGVFNLDLMKMSHGVAWQDADLWIGHKYPNGSEME